MQLKFGFLLGFSIFLISCGSGGSSSSNLTAESGSQQENIVPISFGDASLVVDFPLDGGLSAQQRISFTGQVSGLSNFSDAQIRVSAPSGSYVSNLLADTWIVESVLLDDDTNEEYQVELLVDGEVIDTAGVQLGFESSFIPFGIGQGLAVNESELIAYLLDAGKVVQIDLNTGIRSMISEISSEAVNDFVDILWLAQPEILLLLSASQEIYALEKSDSGWNSLVHLEGLNASAFDSNVTGDEIVVYSPDAHSLVFYDSMFNMETEVSLDGHLSVLEKLAYFDSETMLLLGDDSLVVFNPASGSSDSMSLGELNLGVIGDLALDADREEIFLRSASSNVLWHLQLNFGVSPDFTATQLDLGGSVAYATAYSESIDELLFSSSNQLNSFEPRSSAVSAVSSLAWGGGEAWAAPVSLALSEDGQSLYVSDISTDDIYEVALGTGVRTALNATGESMEAVTGMVQNGQNIYSVDWVKKSVLVTNVGTGLTSDLILDSGVQPNFSEPVAIDLDPSSFRAFVLDRGLRAICEIDTVSGNAEVLVNNLDVPALALAKDLIFDESGETIYWSSWLDNSLHSLNLNNLQHRLISGLERGGGENFGRPSYIALDFERSAVYVSDALDSRIFSVDLETGQRQVIFDSELLSRPSSIAHDPDRGTLNILDAGTGGLYTLDPSSGGLVLISM